MGAGADIANHPILAPARCDPVNFGDLPTLAHDDMQRAYRGLDLLATAVLLLGEGERIVYANPAAENLFEVSRKQLVDRAPAELFGDAAGLLAAIAKAEASGASYTEQELEIGAPRQKLHLTCTVSPVDLPDARLVMEFRHIDQQLKIAREERLLEQQQANRELIRSLAHEIKNPLTPIQMAMDTLRKTWKKQHPDFAEILEESTTTVLEEADRLKHIVSEFSDFARMPKPEFGRIDLNDVVRSVVTLYTDAAPVETHLADKLPELDADKSQINQIVLNLVENARDAISKRQGGKITVSTKLGDAGDRALLIVEDNGGGVPGDLKDKVCLLYTSPSPRDGLLSRMPSSA